MNNKELLKLIEKLVENENIQSIDIKWENLGEYDGQVIKPLVSIVKFKKDQII